jgi:hypothetical protein
MSAHLRFWLSKVNLWTLGCERAVGHRSGSVARVERAAAPCAIPGASSGRRAASQRLEDDTSSPTGRCRDTAVYVCQRVLFQIFAFRVYARKHWTVADYRNEPNWR